MASAKKRDHKFLIISNKKAFFSYHILDKCIGGIVLQGTEVKSIRGHKANFTDAYCYFKGQELWLKGLHISPYGPAGQHNHLPMRPRKLLLQKSRLRALQRKKEEKHLTIIPLSLFISDNNLIKAEIALAKGKKKYDKRIALREKELIRQQQIKEKFE